MVYMVEKCNILFYTKAGVFLNMKTSEMNKMKISCLPVSLFGEICDGKMDILQWAREAKVCGYNGIDISIMFLKNRTPTYLSKLRQGLQDIDMPIVMMTTYSDFTHPCPVQRRRELEYLIADVALASEIGIQYLRILAGQAHPEMGIEDGIGHVLDNFRKIAAYGEYYNVGLLFEDHAKPGAWEYFDFCYPPDIFLRICHGMRGSGIRLNFDTGNITAYGWDTMDVLPKVADLVETVHISDMAEKGRFSPTAIGTGVVPNMEVFSFLKKNSFNGWLCIEEASGQGMEGIKKAHDFVRKAWEDA